MAVLCGNAAASNKAAIRTKFYPLLANTAITCKSIFLLDTSNVVITNFILLLIIYFLMCSSAMTYFIRILGNRKFWFTILYYTPFRWAVPTNFLLLYVPLSVFDWFAQKHFTTMFFMFFSAKPALQTLRLFFLFCRTGFFCDCLCFL